MKHTPGPWKVDPTYYRENPIIATDEKTIAQTNFGGTSKEENYANAYLIAAAPELLEVLKGLVERVDINGGLGEYKEGIPFILKAAREVIIKAEGN